MQAGHGLGGLVYPGQGKSRRASSWDRSGGNADATSIAPGATAAIASLGGAGCIRHVWMTTSSDDGYYLRRTVLRRYWDGEAQPSVEVPLGDFFGVGHGRVSHYATIKDA